MTNSQLIKEKQINDIIHSLRFFPEGASLKQINQHLEFSLPLYTLQRRLAFLLKEKKVHKTGKARAVRYKLSLDSGKSEKQEFSEDKKKSIIPLSSISKNIEQKISQPIQARTPIGYNRKFLDEYRPNVTSYLSEATCEKFLEMGQVNEELPPGTYVKEIFNRILIDLSWNSSRLEGNTYSLLETELLLELSEAAEGKDIKETQMILNHKAAIEFLVDSVEEIAINRQTILNIHALLSDNLLADPRACGCIRSKIIGIAKSVYQPLSIPSVINECFEQILDTAQAIKNPFEQAFFLMVHLPYLQPFEDVNKQVSRLAVNIPLIRLNLPPLSFMDVPKKVYVNGLLAVYELNKIDLLRDVFIWAYERSCALYSATRQSLGEPDPFRLRYRNIIFETVTNIVRNVMNKKEAIKKIREKSILSLPLEDQARFIKTVEIEVRSLHEGNIARYRLRPSEYEAWHKIWH